MGRTNNRAYTKIKIAYIPTGVTWKIPRGDGGKYDLDIPIQNMDPQVNVDIPSDGVLITGKANKMNGIRVSVQVSAGQPLGFLPIRIISPGEYTNEGLSDDLVNNEFNRIEIVENGDSFEVIGDDTTNIYEKLAQQPNFVEDENDRDSRFPTPANLQQVYNQRTNELETYYSQFGLWLSHSKEVYVKEETSTLVRGRICHIDGALSIGSDRYATITEPKTSLERAESIGVVVGEGLETSSGSKKFFYAVAGSGTHLVEGVDAILAGDPVSPRVESGLPSTKVGIVESSGGGGTIGVAVDDIGTPTLGFVWVRIGVTPENH